MAKKEITTPFTDCNTNLHENSESVKLSWNQLIRDSKGQIGEMKLRIGKLKAAIKYFENQQKAGEPCPFKIKRTAATLN